MSASPFAQPPAIPLYPDGAPGSEDWDQAEQWSDIWWSDHKVIRNVTQPTLTPYLPDPAIAQGTGVVLCPGGAWHFLAFKQEGIDVANWLNERGIAAFILKYRLIRTGEDYTKDVQRNMADPDRMAALMTPLRPLLLNDGQQAIRMVRERASGWGLEEDRIGMMGYSAGGSLALNVTLAHEPGCRPDFTAAIYTGSGDELPVPADAGPLFILCAADDEMASGNSLRLYTAWKAAGRTVELHIYSKGGHGFCLRKMNLPVDTWINRFADWLEAHGFYLES
jgi:acetyl esterase/lipase